MAWFQRNPQDIQIIRLTVDHADACAALHRLAFAYGWPALEFERLIAAPTAYGLAAVEGRTGTVRGFVLSRGAAGEAEILTIAVDPAWRRLKLGRRLVTRHLVDLEKAGIGELFLEVDDGNAAALRLYASTGFQQVGRREAYYTDASGAKHAALIMRRSVGTGPLS